jgi:hypothetical protein
LLDMVARVLLGSFAALRAVLITGQADLLSSQPLSWPTLRLPRRLAANPGDRAGVGGKAPAAQQATARHNSPCSR